MKIVGLEVPAVKEEGQTVKAETAPAPKTAKGKKTTK